MDPIFGSVSSLVGMLADGEYQAAARSTDNTRFDATALQEMIEGLGRTLVNRPSRWPDDPATVVTVVQEQPHPVRAVTVPLWTREDGRSEFVLRLSLHQFRGRFWSARIEGIDVTTVFPEPTDEPDPAPDPAMDLHWAVTDDDLDRVRALLDAGVEVDALDPWESTPLLRACFAEQPRPAIVALLRARGADPHRKNIYGQTPRGKAHERFLLHGFDPLQDLPAPRPRKSDAAELTEPEITAVVAAVQALVAHDMTALAGMQPNARPDDDIYYQTYDYGNFGDVELIMPPGESHTWEIRVHRFTDGDSAVDVGMWTRQEGRSDLELYLELKPRADSPPAVTIRNMYVP